MGFLGLAGTLQNSNYQPTDVISNDQNPSNDSSDGSGVNFTSVLDTALNDAASAFKVYEQPVTIQGRGYAYQGPTGTSYSSSPYGTTSQSIVPIPTSSLSNLGSGTISGGTLLIILVVVVLLFMFRGK